MKMSLVLKVDNHQTMVIDEETEFLVGTLIPRYELRNDVGDLVGSLGAAEQAIPLLEARYKANPPRWKRVESGYEKRTWYGILTVERSSCGGWFAFRDRCALLHDSQRAIFSSYPAAKAAADAHLHDGFRSATKSSDNFKWFEYLNEPTSEHFAQADLTAITISGTLDGELDPIVFPARVSEAKQAHIRKVAQVAVLERAIGIATVNVLMTLGTATKGTKSHLEQATNAIAIEMPRMLKLFRRAREYGMPFQTTAVEQGKLLLREIPEAADANDKLLDNALDLPLQFLIRWVSWDKQRDTERRSA
jgi:hypothetical protein